MISDLTDARRASLSGRRCVNLAAILTCFIFTASVSALHAQTVESVTVTPTTVVGGDSVSATVTLSDTAPVGGESVTLSVPTADAADIKLPAAVVVPSGSTTGTAAGIVTTAVTTAVAIPITATLGTSTAEAVLTLVNPGGTFFGANLQFVSVPYYYKDALSNIFVTEPTSQELFLWDATSYSTEGDPYLVTISPGYGYWATFLSPGTYLSYLGVPASNTVATTIPLSTGWNSIGDPYAVPINIADLTFSANDYSFAVATSPSYSLISPILYFFLQDPSGKSGTYGPANYSETLAPGQGYWIYAFNATTLNFPPPLVPVTTTTIPTTTIPTTTIGRRHAF